jgi:hypothetical protein
LCHGLAGSGQTDSRSPQRRAALKRLWSWGERMSIFFKPVRSAFKRTHFCCAADGSFQFERYRAWWEQVARVEVLDAYVQERQPAEVVVQATVRYAMRRGTVTEEHHQFRLVAEPATQRWLIAAQTRGVQRPRAR